MLLFTSIYRWTSRPLDQEHKIILFTLSVVSLIGTGLNKLFYSPDPYRLNMVLFCRIVPIEKHMRTSGLKSENILCGWLFVKVLLLCLSSLLFWFLWLSGPPLLFPEKKKKNRANQWIAALVMLTAFYFRLPVLLLIFNAQLIRHGIWFQSLYTRIKSNTRKCVWKAYAPIICLILKRTDRRREWSLHNKRNISGPTVIKFINTSPLFS